MQNHADRSKKTTPFSHNPHEEQMQDCGRAHIFDQSNCFKASAMRLLSSGKAIVTRIKPRPSSRSLSGLNIEFPQLVGKGGRIMRREGSKVEIGLRRERADAKSAQFPSQSLGPSE